ASQRGAAGGAEGGDLRAEGCDLIQDGVWVWLARLDAFHRRLRRPRHFRLRRRLLRRRRRADDGDRLGVSPRERQPGRLQQLVKRLFDRELAPVRGDQHPFLFGGIRAVAVEHAGLIVEALQRLRQRLLTDADRVFLAGGGFFARVLSAGGGC